MNKKYNKLNKLVSTIIICIAYESTLIFDLKGQNLVPNPSFEDVNICTEYKKSCSPSAWFFIESLTGKYCDSEFIKAASGQRYLDLVVVDETLSTRQYWETMLLCPLIKSKKYQIKIKVASNLLGPNLHDIGFYFTKSFIFSSRDTLLQPDNYVSLFGAKARRLKGNWFELEKVITADDSYSFLILGNFSNKSNIEIWKTRNVQNHKINLLIDDVVVKPLDSKICDDFKNKEVSLYSIKERHVRDIKTNSISDPSIFHIIPKTDTLIIPNLFFETNSFNLKDANLLDSFAQKFSDTTVKRIEIIGFTDSTGSLEFNQKLSLNRAKSIEKLIITKFKINDSLISVIGKGVSKLYPDNKDNRRVHIYLYH